LIILTDIAHVFAKTTPMNTNNSNNNDLYYWVRMQQGDESAFNFMMKKYFNQLLNYGYKFVKDEDFLKDCVQEVFIEIWKRRERLSVPESVKAYLLSSVRKKVVRENFRQNSDKESLELSENTTLFEFSSEWFMIQEETETQVHTKVNEILAALPKRQREVIYLQYYQNLSREEIAQIMDINPQSVSNLLQSAFKSFRSKWNGTDILLALLWQF
jgi:RNA polymerase sigma factor (sigma-70 family)